MVGHQALMRARRAGVHDPTKRPLALKYVCLLVLALAAAGCEDWTPTPVVTLTVSGPARMEVGSSAVFTVSANGGAVSGVSWSTTAPGVLSITAQGFGAANRAGVVTVHVSAEGATASMRVLVVPKLLGLVIEGLPSTINVGDVFSIQLVVQADRGDGPEALAPSFFVSLLPAGSAQLAWSSPTPAILAVHESVLSANEANVRAVQAGEGRVVASVAGATATAFTTVVGASPTAPPVAATPADLNGVFSFALTRGAGDCGLGLMPSIAGTLTVSGVPSSGQGGRATLDYGTSPTLSQLAVTLTAADLRLLFNSEQLRVDVERYYVVIQGDVERGSRTGRLNYLWAPEGQPSSAACAIFEGPLTGR